MIPNVSYIIVGRVAKKRLLFTIDSSYAAFIDSIISGT